MKLSHIKLRGLVIPDAVTECVPTVVIDFDGEVLTVEKPIEYAIGSSSSPTRSEFSNIFVVNDIS